jgi:hypothetical protein
MRAKLLTLAIPFAFLLTPAWAQTPAQSLSLTIGNAVAGQSYVVKSAQFVFRINGCADLSRAQIRAVGEGIVDGARRTTPLRVVPAQPAGVYGINPQWGANGKWVVTISTTCGDETAAAIVPVNGMGFIRESTQLLKHTPSPAEIDAALKAFNPPAR